MSVPRNQDDTIAQDSRASVFLGSILIVLALLAAYVSSFGGVFVFDDHHAILENPTIRNLGRIDRILLVPGAVAGTLGGRPIANLTLAVNYAISGTDPRSYHAVNLLVHCCAALVLFGILRRTFDHLRNRDRFGSHRIWIAWAITTLWALHPLQTESVTYIVQRVESLMGLFYLLTLYCFIRAMHSSQATRWYVAAFVACLFGMGTKEVMVSAPFIVLLYDRTFVAASWRDVWRRRRGNHAALASTWLLLAVVVTGTQGRGGSAGFNTTMMWWEYALTQCHAIVHYLRLSIWPHPLVFDYGSSVVREIRLVALPALFLLFLVGGTIWAMVRKPVLGFLGAWFFVILSPSSSVVPVATQTMAEHRLYLPLAAVIVLAVVSAYSLGRRAGFVGITALALVAGVVTARRNKVYHSELALWSDTVAHRPQNARAHTNLGLALIDAGRAPAAIASYEAALRLQPDNAATHLNLCAALRLVGRAEEAVLHGQEALRLDPTSVAAHINLANALVDLRRFEGAIQHFRAALQLEPSADDAHLALASVLLEQDRPAEAIVHYEAVARLKPDDPEIRLRLARANLAAGDVTAARRASEKALQLDPGSPDALYALGNLAAGRGEISEAIDYFSRAVNLAPLYIPARNNLANVLLVAGRVDEAITHYREVLRLKPDEQSVRENLAYALELQGAAR